MPTRRRRPGCPTRRAEPASFHSLSRAAFAQIDVAIGKGGARIDPARSVLATAALKNVEQSQQPRVVCEQDDQVRDD